MFIIIFLQVLKWVDKDNEAYCIKILFLLNFLLKFNKKNFNFFNNYEYFIEKILLFVFC